MPPIQIERFYNRPIQEVWEIVTDQKHLAKWLMPGNFEPIVGKQYQFNCQPEEECADYVYGEVLNVLPPNSIKFTWNSKHLHNTTVVSFLLEETKGGVTFKIEHEGFAKQDAMACEKHTVGWAHHLNQIEKIGIYEEE